jgi:COMPASS component SWD3
VSGGWDHTLQIWDVRVNRSVRSIYGPYVCGDSIDVHGGVILAGSWRHAHPLELWDLGTCKLLTCLPFWQPEQDACLPYAAKFGRGHMDGEMAKQ